MKAINISPKQLLTEVAAAKLLNCSPALLRKWRYAGRGSAYIRLGRLIRYRRSDIEVFIHGQAVLSEAA